jgi:hypothetical protein
MLWSGEIGWDWQGHLANPQIHEQNLAFVLEASMAQTPASFGY